MYRSLLLGFCLTAFAADSLIQIDPQKLISRADLNFDTPASRPEEGMPIGNGRTGSLIWTTPSALKLQINRVDAHAMDSTTVSFPRAGSDYGSVCGYIDINVVDAGEDVFTGRHFHQHLSLYDALMTAQGNGLTARASLRCPRAQTMPLMLVLPPSARPAAWTIERPLTLRVGSPEKFQSSGPV